MPLYGMHYNVHRVKWFTLLSHLVTLLKMLAPDIVSGWGSVCGRLFTGYTYLLGKTSIYEYICPLTEVDWDILFKRHCEYFQLWRNVIYGFAIFHLQTSRSSCEYIDSKLVEEVLFWNFNQVYIKTDVQLFQVSNEVLQMSISGFLTPNTCIFFALEILKLSLIYKDCHITIFQFINMILCLPNFLSIIKLEIEFH